MTTSQTTLFEDDDAGEPAPNSREDLGFTKKSEPILSTLPIDQAVALLDWLDDQDVKKSDEIRLIGIMEALSGMTPLDLRWLCRAIHQAGVAPAPALMAAAVKARDVAILRRRGSGA